MRREGEGGVVVGGDEEVGWITGGTDLKSARVIVPNILSAVSVSDGGAGVCVD